MKKYTNVNHQNNQGSWAEVGTFTGEQLQFSASNPKTVVGGVSVVFGKSKIRVSKPRTVQSCDTDCSVGTVTESVELTINVVDEASLDALKAELERVLAVNDTKSLLLHGIIPPAYEAFADE